MYRMRGQRGAAVGEPMFLRNEGAAPITASPVLQEARPPEHGRAIFSLGPGIGR